MHRDGDGVVLQPAFLGSCGRGEEFCANFCFRVLWGPWRGGWFELSARYLAQCFGVLRFSANIPDHSLRYCYTFPSSDG